MSTREKYIEIHASKAGLRGKVNAMCISCVYDEHVSGTWRNQTENCTVTLCPLWEVRPKPLLRGKKAEEPE